MRYTGAVLLLLAMMSAQDKRQTSQPGRGESEKQATLVQQKACADQARTRFVEDGYTSTYVRGTRDLQHASYTNHYDIKTSVCYVEVLTVNTTSAKNNALLVSRLVYDAFEGRLYANLTIVMGDGHPSIIGTSSDPSVCRVKPSGQPAIQCSIEDEDEFDALVNKYFGLDRR